MQYCRTLDEETLRRCKDAPQGDGGEVSSLAPLRHSEVRSFRTRTEESSYLSSPKSFIGDPDQFLFLQSLLISSIVIHCY